MEEEHLKNEISALNLSIENEKQVRKFYLENAKKIKNSLARKAFIFLADEELKHIDAISVFNNSIHGDNVPEIEASKEDEAITKTKNFLLSQMDDRAKEAVMSDDDVKVYELALEVEMKGYNFYKEAAEKSENKNIKKLFKFLMKEENAHYHLVSNIIDYMKDPAGWHQNQEKWMFEG